MKLISFPEAAGGGKRVRVLSWFRGVEGHVGEEVCLLGQLPFPGAGAEKKKASSTTTPDCQELPRLRAPPEIKKRW